MAPFPALVAAMVLLGATALGRIGIDGYEYVQLEAEHARLEAEIDSIFRATFPEEHRIVNPRSQFRQKLLEVTRGADADGEFQMLLSAVAQANAGTPVRLLEVSFRDNTLEVVCVVTNFTELDRLQEQLSLPGFAVALVASGTLEDRVTGRFRLSRANQG